MWKTVIEATLHCMIVWGGGRLLKRVQQYLLGQVCPMLPRSLTSQEYRPRSAEKSPKSSACNHRGAISAAAGWARRRSALLVSKLGNWLLVCSGTLCCKRTMPSKHLSQITSIKLLGIDRQTHTHTHVLSRSSSRLKTCMLQIHQPEFGGVKTWYRAWISGLLGVVYLLTACVPPNVAFEPRPMFGFLSARMLLPSMLTALHLLPRSSKLCQATSST